MRPLQNATVHKAAMATRTLVVSAAMVLFALGCRADVFAGRCTAVLDGDTVEVLRQTAAGPRPVRVRLWGVDCPEKSQAYGQRAKQFTSSLAFGKAATVDVRDTDRYGRSVALVTVGRQQLNAELVRAGFAWWYRQYAPAADDLRDLERAARAARRGLWADTAPVPPWDYRHKPAKSSSSSPPAAGTATRATSQSSSQAGGATVWIGNTGTKCHKAGCRTLRGQGHQVPLSEALKQGRAACKVCGG